MTRGLFTYTAAAVADCDRRGCHRRSKGLRCGCRGRREAVEAHRGVLRYEVWEVRKEGLNERKTHAGVFTAPCALMTLEWLDQRARCSSVEYYWHQQQTASRDTSRLFNFSQPYKAVTLRGLDLRHILPEGTLTQTSRKQLTAL